MSLFEKEELYSLLRDAACDGATDAKEAQKLTRKEFLSWLGDFAGSIRESIRATHALDPAKSAQRVKKARKDFDFFRRTYFPHYYTLPGKSELQEDMEQTFLRVATKREYGEKFAKAAPRGFGKSTDASVVFPIWLAAYDLKKFVTIFSDAIELTETLIEAVKAELEENDRLRADFPHICGTGRVWKVGEIVTKSGMKIKGYGSGKRVRGVKHGVYRVDMVIVDDLENDENVRSRTQRDKLEEWFDSAIDNLGSVDGKLDILYIGTILHRDSVLARKLKLKFWHPKIFRALKRYPTHMEMWDIYTNLYKHSSAEKAHRYYLENRAKMDQGAELLWDAVSLEYLMQKRATNPKAFEKEQQNRPNSENQKFDSSKFAKISPSQMPRLDKTFLYTDFKGDSLKRGSDYFALIGAGISKARQKLYVFYSYRERIKGKTAIDFLVSLQRERAFSLIGGERNSGFYMARDWFREKCFEEGIVAHTKFLHNSEAKEDRIGELEFPIDAGDIVFVGDHPALFNELDDFPESDFDDLSDCLAGVYRLSKIKKRSGQKRTLYKKRRRR